MEVGQNTLQINNTDYPVFIGNLSLSRASLFFVYWFIVVLADYKQYILSS